MNRRDEGGLGALGALVKPMARKFITRENIDQLFSSLTADADLDEGEKAVILLNRAADGTVMAGVYAVGADRHISRRYSTMSVEELVLALVNG